MEKGSSQENSEIRNLFDMDQKDRHENLYKNDPKLFVNRDNERYKKAVEFYTKHKKEILVLNVSDKYHLAMIFQHGHKPEDYLRTQELALQAVDEGDDRGRWLSKAAEDRHLGSIGEKQKWGTQYKVIENGEWQLLPMQTYEESGVTDEMRKMWNVPLCSESESFNKK
ncbi:MAG: hypothetical protein ACI8V7_000322 [Candidatus Paceibacteria bacterium]|jgi:hypothetical protein